MLRHTVDRVPGISRLWWREAFRDARPIEG